ncbi:MAG: hypothetical protein KY454_14180, partial [Actinobacteria bacterium]|nr:hypothetical protein [Actinomycetota bacterium]
INQTALSMAGWTLPQGGRAGSPARRPSRCCLTLTRHRDLASPPMPTTTGQSGTLPTLRRSTSFGLRVAEAQVLARG